MSVGQVTGSLASMGVKMSAKAFWHSSQSMLLNCSKKDFSQWYLGLPKIEISPLGRYILKILICPGFFLSVNLSWFKCFIGRESI